MYVICFTFWHFNLNGKFLSLLDSRWNVMAHGDAREGKWRGNWWTEWVASTLHTTSEHGVSSITTADARTSAASSRLKWHPCRFKWTRLFLQKTKSGCCACAITFQTQSTKEEAGWIPQLLWTQWEMYVCVCVCVCVYIYIYMYIYLFSKGTINFVCIQNSG
jgi:hypothetical protein